MKSIPTSENLKEMASRLAGSELFDTHTHFLPKRELIDEKLRRAADAGVTHILAVGGNTELNAGAKLAVEISRAVAGITCLAAIGFDRDQTECRIDVEQITSERNDICAIGELGLDYSVSQTDRRGQLNLLDAELRIAAELEKPVIIHTRGADDDTLAVLRNAAAASWFRSEHHGVIHCFCGGASFAEALLDLGYYISFSGILTFNNAASLRETCKLIPLERLLIETDSPYLTPVPLRGLENEPAFVIYTADVLSRQRGITISELADVTNKNAKALFNLVPNDPVIHQKGLS